MGPGAHFAEDGLVALDEDLHAEDAPAAQSARDGGSDAAGLLFGLGAHGLGLPGLLIVAVDLMVSHGFEEDGAVDAADGQLGDLVVEVHEAFDDDPARSGPAAFLRDLPRRIDVLFLLDGALAVAGGAHDGLHHAGKTDLLDGLTVFLVGSGEAVGRGRQTQFLGGQTADPLTVHGESRGPGGGDHVEPFFFQLHQRVGGDGFDFGNDEVGLFQFDDPAEFLAVEHVDHMAPVGGLHAGGVGIAVHGDGFHAQTLHCDDDFAAQLSCTAEEDFGGLGG